MCRFNYEEEDWIIGVVESLIRQTKADYIKGAKMLYSYYKYIPTEQEAMDNEELYKKIQVSNYLRPLARYFFDAKRFVEEDPYGIFVTVVKREVFADWDKEAKAKSC